MNDCVSYILPLEKKYKKKAADKIGHISQLFKTKVTY